MNNIAIIITSRICLCAKNMCLLFLIGTSISFADQLDNTLKISELRQASPLIERNMFMKRGPIRQIGLSPDGTYLSYVLNKASRSELWIFEIENTQHRRLFISKDIDGVYWSADSQLLFIQTNAGVSGVSVTAGKIAKLIINLDASKDEYFYGVDHSQDQAVIVSMKQDRGMLHELMRVLSDGSKQVLRSGIKRSTDYVIGNSGNLIAVAEFNDKGFDLIDVRTSQNKLIKHCEFTDDCSLHHFNENTEQLYLKARFDEDLASLYALNIKTKMLEIIHQDPKGKFDLKKVYYKNGIPKLTQYTDHFISQYPLDDEITTNFDKISELVQHKNNLQPVLYVKPDKKFRRWLIFDYGLTSQGHDIYLYNTKSQILTEPLKSLFKSKEFENQFIQPQFIAQKVPVEYQVSDGMWQFGYVTLPNGIKAKDAPLIVVPHGGPWSRVTGNYSSITQLLANRGYAVFQPNFRSSTGMGRNYVLSANKDFGDGRVQQDIIDGLQYVLSRGVGDPHKLAIFGHSFGGFSTLAALAFTPDLFKVGVAGAAPSDLSKSIKQLAANKLNHKDKVRQQKLMTLAVDLNDPQDLQRLTAQSPDANWQTVKRPLYMLAGGKDDRVAVTGVRDYAIRLEQADKPISLLIDEDEGHGFKKDIALEAYAYVLEYALATHLDGHYQQQVSNNLKRYLQRKMVIDTNRLLDSVH